MTKVSPLLDLHRELGAKLTAFGGWDMPLQYTGVIAEHTAVRTGVGIFDVSHLGKLLVSGPKAGERLQFAVTADVIALDVGRATYALVLTDEAGCVDDVFVYRLEGDLWLVVPNAANVEAVADRITGDGVDVEDAWDRWAILAIQGPESFEAFEKVFPSSTATDLKLHDWMPIDVSGADGLVARTGYTGERGFELYAPAESARWAFESLLEAGCTPVGLGARDTLRLEMGYALYGHELALDINPLEAGLGWAVAWESPFRGKEELLEIRSEGPARRLFGIVCRDRGVPRQGYPVYAADRVVGQVTSGNHSPTLQTGIALALGPREAVPEVGAEKVAIEARGRMIAGDIVKPPFIKRR
ncbi:MAG TPA: glycine cleavage system aminomethyltransferase GcvT [Actinomycetota bacterium]|nr:glycine cleavage system aminomethyltransferase GcvT [Actinomycetota bacterium]